MNDRPFSFDIVVVGAGPAGLAAACAAAESGARAAVVDDTPWLGGQIWRGQQSRPVAPQAQGWFDRFRNSGATLLDQTSVIASPEPGLLLAEHLNGPRQIRGKKLILATGARELFLPFPGWTLPGVIGPGGLLTLVKNGWPIRGQRVVVAGSGPLLLAVADGLKKFGADVISIVEQAPFSKVFNFGLQLAAHPGKLWQAAQLKLRLAGVPYHCGAWPVHAAGDEQVRGVTLTNGQRTWTESCDLFACGFGLVPNVELPLAMGCELSDGFVRVDADQSTSVADVYCAGEPTGIGGADCALVEGQIAGYAAAGNKAKAESFFGQRSSWHRFRSALATGFALRPELKSLATDDTLICRCEDVTLGRMRQFTNWREAKLQSRCGMGACQGRVCGAAAKIILGWGMDSVRPPVLPARVQSLISKPAESAGVRPSPGAATIGPVNAPKIAEGSRLTEVAAAGDGRTPVRRTFAAAIFVFMSLLGSASFLSAAPIQPVIPDVARPLPLAAVRLTGGPLKHAQDLDAEYLLKLEPDRMLAYFRKRAGLEPRAQPYAGWDGDGKNLTGHIAGHYLSAVSLMWAATGDARFKERADYIVKELKEVQDAQGDGYLGALANGKERFAEVAQGNIRSGGFDLNGLWSPWYVLHKDYAGLRDAYRFTGNPTALDLEVKFAAWAESILSKLNEGQLQKMLNTEFGGMNEVLADLYADTGDKRWLDLSRRFEHHAVLDPLKRHQDRLAGLHGNTQVPKLMGSLARFVYTGDAGDGFAAGFFWDRVAQHHSYATGGHGKDEYFGEPDKLSDRVDGRTAETCNVYNMLKMTRKCFALRPDIEYADFHERALFNHILASIDPEDGRTCYMVNVGRGVQHEYQEMFRSFTCCVGSGMESHALHGDGLYYESGDRLWVNLYAPSTAEWKAAGVRLAMETSFPEGDSATLKLALAAPREFTLALRRPSWAKDGFSVTVNGDEIKDLSKPGSYIELKRTWKNDDTVALVLPKALHLEPMPDNPRRVAILWGPLVLAGDLGPENPSRGRNRNPASVPVFVAADRPVADWLKPVPDKPGNFRSDGVGREKDVDLMPFYRLHRRIYAVYWDLFTPADWEKKAAEIAAEREHQHKLELATVAFAQPGEMQPERDFNMQGEDTSTDRVMGRPARRGNKWFSFDLPADPTHPMALVVSYYSDEWRKRTFEIQVEGQKVGEQTIEKGGPVHFFDVEYAVPATLVQGKQKVTVRFQATNGNEIAAIFGLRMIRADAER